jgi:hypothetical protein
MALLCCDDSIIRILSSGVYHQELRGLYYQDSIIKRLFPRVYYQDSAARTLLSGLCCEEYVGTGLLSGDAVLLLESTEPNETPTSPANAPNAEEEIQIQDQQPPSIPPPMNESSTPTTLVQAERLAGCFVTKTISCFLDPITV